MTMTKPTAALLPLLALTLALGGCAVSSEPEEGLEATEATEESTEALSIGNLRATPPRPVTHRRLVHTRLRGCDRIAGAGGSWVGSPVVGDGLSSRSFCAYSWSTSSGAHPDHASLDATTVFDQRWRGGHNYNVPDPRPANSAAPQASISAAPQSSISAISTQFSASQTSASTQKLGFTGGTGPVKRGQGCDSCVSWQGNYLWFVLPPEAVPAAVVVYSGGVQYTLEDAPGSVFYTPVPSGFSGTPFLNWL
jgi:hypothetical protein